MYIELVSRRLGMLICVKVNIFRRRRIIFNILLTKRHRLKYEYDIIYYASKNHKHVLCDINSNSNTSRK